MCEFQTFDCLIFIILSNIFPYNQLEAFPIIIVSATRLRGRAISLLCYQRAAFSNIGTDNKRAIGNRSRINLLMDPPPQDACGSSFRSNAARRDAT